MRPAPHPCGLLLAVARQEAVHLLAATFTGDVVERASVPLTAAEALNAHVQAPLVARALLRLSRSLARQGWHCQGLGARGLSLAPPAAVALLRRHWQGSALARLPLFIEPDLPLTPADDALAALAHRVRPLFSQPLAA